MLNIGRLVDRGNRQSSRHLKSSIGVSCASRDPEAPVIDVTCGLTPSSAYHPSPVSHSRSFGSFNLPKLGLEAQDARPLTIPSTHSLTGSLKCAKEKSHHAANIGSGAASHARSIGMSSPSPLHPGVFFQLTDRQ